MSAFWLLILGLALTSYLPRASFILLFARWPVPARLQRALRYVPAAVFSAILVPALVLTAGAVDIGPGQSAPVRRHPRRRRRLAHAQYPAHHRQRACWRCTPSAICCIKNPLQMNFATSDLEEYEGRSPPHYDINYYG